MCNAGGSSCTLGFIRKNVRPAFEIEPLIVLNGPLRFGLSKASDADQIPARPNVIVYDLKILQYAGEFSVFP